MEEGDAIFRWPLIPCRLCGKSKTLERLKGAIFSPSLSDAFRFWVSMVPVDCLF